MNLFAPLILGIGAAAAIGGLYILFLAFFKPEVFPKPNLAKRQGAIALVVGIIVLLLYFRPWQR
jgi:hypothetical protein